MPAPPPGQAIYVSKGDQDLGPFTFDELVEQIREKAANSDDGPVFRPAQIRYLNMSFKDKPAVFGVQVLKGQIRVGQELLRDDGTGRVLGKIMSIGTEGETVAHEGQQVPIQVNIRFSRSNISDDEIFYGNVLEEDSKYLYLLLVLLL